MRNPNTLTRGVGSWLWAVVLVAGTGGCAMAADGRELVVQAGGQDRAMVPMCVDAPAGLTNPKLVDAGTNKTVPCQLCGGKLCWILDALSAGKTKTYRVSSGGTCAPVVEVVKGAKAYDVKIAGKAFTSLRCDPDEIRPYCYPLFGPGQTRTTRGYPMEHLKGERPDHHHHRSFYVAHGELNNKKYNFWHEPKVKSEQDRQIIREVVRAEGGPVFGVIEAVIDWTGRDGKKVVAERRVLKFYALDGAARMLDMSVTFDAQFGDVHFGDTKEGGICAIRVAPEIRETKLKDGSGGTGRLTNSDGKVGGHGGGAWGKRAEWVDYSRVKGGQYGIALFDCRKNLRHPPYWHARNYGLLTANPFGIKCFDKRQTETGDYTLAKGQKLVLRYRLYLHQGDCQGAKVAARYEDYVNPPKATWK